MKPVHLTSGLSIVSIFITKMAELTMEELAYYRMKFNSYDHDGNGVIDKKELTTVLKEMGIKASKKEVKEMLKEFDVNNDGVIDCDEFLNMLGKTSKAVLDEAELRRAFQEIDTDGNGTISVDELRKHLKKMEKISEDELVAMFKQLDKNGDGSIDYEEFLCLLYV